MQPYGIRSDLHICHTMQAPYTAALPDGNVPVTMTWWSYSIVFIAFITIMVFQFLLATHQHSLLHQ